jgi:integrase
MMAKLTALEVAKIVNPGTHRIDDGLYLQIRGGTRSWLHRFQFDGRPRWSGLGSAADVTLAQARAKRDDERALIRSGVDPVAARRVEKAEAAVAQAKAVTFRECAEAYIAAHEGTWSNAVYRGQWSSTLEDYVYPVAGAIPVKDIDTALAMRMLEPIWPRIPWTAAQVRSRCERILDWAKAREYRSGENPFRWRGHLNMLLPKISKLAPKKHHAALPYERIGEFMAELRAREGFAVRALEFTILTAARSGEVLGATWTEFGTIRQNSAVWIVPAARMKNRQEHRVPLCARAVEVLDEMAAVRGTTEFVFQGRGGRLSDMAMLKLMERHLKSEFTVHGFRSSFRDWAAECTNYPREVVEKALAHTIGDETERAYQRGDLLEKRRRLMDAWADYCARPAVEMGEVIPLRA